MPTENYTVSYGVDVNEAGQSRLETILEKNDKLAASVAGSFEAAVKNIEAYKKIITQGIPTLFGNYGGVTEGATKSGINVALNLDEANKEYDAFVKKLEKPIPLKANVSGIVSAANSALESVRAMFGQSFYLNVKANANVDEKQDNSKQTNQSRLNSQEGNSAFLRMSMGGRFTNPTSVQVAEDGDAEYIIPVKKENRAIPLLKQLISEMSPEGRKSVLGAQDKPKELSIGSVISKEDQKTEESASKALKVEKQDPLKVEKLDPLKVEEQAPLRVEKLDPLKIEKADPLKVDKLGEIKIPKFDSLKVEKQDPLKVEKLGSVKLDQGVTEKAREGLVSSSIISEFKNTLLSSVQGMGMIRSAAVSNVGGKQINETQNNNNVSAPVTINVNASGANAAQIGKTIYNTAERYLLRTMKGVFA